MFRPTFGLLFGVLVALQTSVTCAAITVSSTILVFARDATSATAATLGLQGYGIPYQLVVVPQAGITLPALASSGTAGNYGGIVVVSEVAYDYPTGWTSAITPEQWQTIYNYQLGFGVRLVRLDSFPSTDLGTLPPSSTCQKQAHALQVLQPR